MFDLCTKVRGMRGHTLAAGYPAALKGGFIPQRHLSSFESQTPPHTGRSGAFPALFEDEALLIATLVRAAPQLTPAASPARVCAHTHTRNAEKVSSSLLIYRPPLVPCLPGGPVAFDPERRALAPHLHHLDDQRRLLGGLPGRGASWHRGQPGPLAPN